MSGLFSSILISLLTEKKKHSVDHENYYDFYNSNETREKVLMENGSYSVSNDTLGLKPFTKKTYLVVSDYLNIHHKLKDVNWRVFVFYVFPFLERFSNSIETGAVFYAFTS